MVATDPEIARLIPHRPPFLWVDRILEYEKTGTLIAEKYIATNLDIFDGHYPDQPILPGVILCEALFQTGALLMAKLAKESLEPVTQQVPVVTRIGGARFKRQIGPGDTIQMKVTLTETISSVAFFKGTLRLKGKVAAQVDFSCALVNKN